MKYIPPRHGKRLITVVWGPRSVTKQWKTEKTWTTEKGKEFLVNHLIGRLGGLYLPTIFVMNASDGDWRGYINGQGEYCAIRLDGRTIIISNKKFRSNDGQPLPDFERRQTAMFLRELKELLLNTQFKKTGQRVSYSKGWRVRKANQKYGAWATALDYDIEEEYLALQSDVEKARWLVDNAKEGIIRLHTDTPVIKYIREHLGNDSIGLVQQSSYGENFIIEDKHVDIYIDGQEKPKQGGIYAYSDASKAKSLQR